MNIELKDELEIRNILVEPHFSYLNDDTFSRKQVSLSILQRKNEDIILIDSYGFNFDSIFAGLTEKQIEYIAKNTPKNYKDNIIKILKNQEMMKGVHEIAKSIDEDLGGDFTQNQERIKNVIQYIKDNRAVFEF
jgi:hypothetical protein